jgi:ATP-dependent DNA helicase RecG
MKKADIDFIIKQGEGQFIEFKESLDKSLAKEITAFSNAQGGRIFLGISDKGECKGIRITNEIKAQIHDIAHNCDPPIKVSIETISNLLIISVPEGENKPYSCSHGFYLRNGASAPKMSRDEILDFAISEGRIRFDEQINENFKFETDVDEKKLDEYLKEAKLTIELDTESTLINLGVAKRNKSVLKLNNAGILFFAKNPSRFFLSSKVVCALFQGNERINILDRKIYDNGILDNLKETITYVKKHIDTKFVIETLKRQEVEQFPEKAYRELIVNAIMHRDYADNSSDILIEIHKNKLTVSNPGGLVKWLKPENFGKESKTRNSVIASLLSRTIYVEKMGTGIKRIRDAVKIAKLPEPLFSFDEHFFSVELYDEHYSYVSKEKIREELKSPENVPENVPEKVTVKVPEKVTVNQHKIIEAVGINTSITVKEMSVIVGISERKIKENIAKLKEKGMLKRVGPDKGGHWEVLK